MNTFFGIQIALLVAKIQLEILYMYDYAKSKRVLC